jgi:L-fucose mutarotase
MLKGIDPILTPDVLHALCSMGHGDEVAVVDAHYPADAAGRSSSIGKVLRLDGVDSARAIRAVLSVLPLDSFVPHPAERMQVDDEPETLPQVQREAQAEVNTAAGEPELFATVVRQDFYERAKKTYCVIITGETRGWGCFIFKKGLETSPDAPRTEGHTATAQWSAWANVRGAKENVDVI